MGTRSGRGEDRGMGGRGDGGTGRCGRTISLLAISSSSHSMGIGCVRFLLSSSPFLPVPASPSPPVSRFLSFLSVNVEFLRVTLDWRARFAREREDVVAAIFGRQVNL